ncbi:conserved hypothetical protein (plasmid) [Polaromonas naphthalenivorans CJ2]|uniref:ATPase n=2 Tax=Polaromonas naphthalenivorans TaxID=216465 RepID=A1VWH5_POLNA|nr:conserved hypothetical protein [Polaromonas naphthalenivorans CJ2]
MAIAIFTTIHDNEAMTTFDDIEVRRPGIAQAYLALLAAQPGRPLALFAPRRVGKTFFLDHDLAPKAKEAGMLPVYADLWLHKSAPLEAVNHALEEALDDLRVPRSHLGKLAKTPVKKIGALGASLDLGDEPQRRPLPESAALRLDALVTRLARQHKGQVLLMLDEVQTLGEVPDGVSLIASLRAVLHKRREDVAAVFTGSSQEGLARLMTTAGAPMYQFAQIIDFPFLGDEFLRLLAAHFSKVHPGKTLEMVELRDGFQRIGFKPALMRDVVKAMSAEGITDVARGIDNYMASGHQVAIWRALLNSVDAFDQGVLVVVAKGQPPLSQATLETLATIPGSKPTISKVRSSIEKLKRNGLLSKNAGGTTIDDPLFAEFLSKKGSMGLALPIA